MKRKYFSVIMAAALLGAGCSHEFVSEDRDVIIDGNTEPGVIHFALPPVPKSITYTRATEKGDDSEYIINTMGIYQFDKQTGKFDRGYVYDKNNPDPNVTLVDLAATDPVNKRTLKVNIGPEFEGEKHFYFVANVDGAATDRLCNVNLGVNATTEAEFLKAMQSISSAATGTAKPGVIFPGDPHFGLPMYSATAGAAASDPVLPYVVVNVSNLVAEGYKVTLRRAVARIDVVNYCPASGKPGTGQPGESLFTNFNVTNIDVTGVNTKGEVFPSANPYDGPALERAKFTLDGTDPIKAINEPTLDSNGAIVNKAAFYILPSTLEKSATQIWIHGVFNGSDRILPVSLPSTVKDSTLMANKIYRIKVQQFANKDVIVQVEVADYDEALTLPSEVDQTVKILKDDKLGQFYTMAPNASDPTKTDSTAVPATGYVNYFPAANAVIEYVISSESNTSTPIINGLTNDMILTVKTPAKFVPTPQSHYETVYNITLPYQDAAPMVKDTLFFKNPVKGDTIATLVIQEFVPQYMKSGFYPVKVVIANNTWYWAPFNVGASTVPTKWDATTYDQTFCGNYYQWGRSNSPFAYNHAPTTVCVVPPDSPIQADLNTFYAAPFGTGTTAYIDWLSTPIETLWQGADAQGPCPPGYRVPTNAELAPVINGKSLSGSTNFKYINIPGATLGSKATNLFIPAPGYIAADVKEANSGKLTNVGNSFGLWTSTPDPANSHKSYRVYTDGGKIDHRSMGYNVRCVAKTKLQ